jgi:tryptophan synthase alpha chain
MVDSNKKLSVFFTAGFPKITDTVEILSCIQESKKVDFVEVGMPYSDPLADGPTIQDTSLKAIKNGMTVSKLFLQIKDARKKGITLPIYVMGYYNQVLQYGDMIFLEDAKDSGIDGFIIPDLPIEIYQEKYLQKVQTLGLKSSFLITPKTKKERAYEIAKCSSGFVYAVSSNQITGTNNQFIEKNSEYDKLIQDIKKQVPVVMGFGIYDKNSFEKACEIGDGAIIGSAFLKAIQQKNTLKNNISEFLQSIKS